MNSLSRRDYVHLYADNYHNEVNEVEVFYVIMVDHQEYKGN